MFNPTGLSSRVLTLVAMTCLGCSGGSSAPSARVDAQAGGDALPDGPTMSDAGTAAAPDAPDDPARTPDARDASAKQDAGSDLPPAADASVPAQPPYAEGSPFGRLQYDLLGKRYGEWVCAVLPQANGQTILVGTANTTFVAWFDVVFQNAITLVRLNADGKVDPTFGTAGKTVFTMSPHPFNVCRAAAQTKDGKIIVAGDMVGSGVSAGSDLNRDFALVRFNPDGTLDTTFGSEGVTTTSITLPGIATLRDDLAASLLVLDDGRIVVGGSTAEIVTGNKRPVLARYTADGALDPTFGTGGTLVLEPSKTSNLAFLTVPTLLAESDGSLLAGISFTLGYQKKQFALARILPDGTLDPAFASAGVHVETLGSDDGQIELKQLSRDADGNVVALVATVSSTDHQAILYRYTAQAVLDASFGTAGRVTVQLKGVGAYEPLCMLRPADGSILVGLGATGQSTSGNFDLIRFSARGVYDDGFGEPSWTWDPLYSSFVTAAGQFDNGDIVVAGHIATKDNTDTIVMHLKKNASPLP
jgi:uncharacterized delta-60 repeat protein